MASEITPAMQDVMANKNINLPQNPVSPDVDAGEGRQEEEQPVPVELAEYYKCQELAEYTCPIWCWCALPFAIVGFLLMCPFALCEGCLDDICPCVKHLIGDSADVEPAVGPATADIEAGDAR